MIKKIIICLTIIILIILLSFIIIKLSNKSSNKSLICNYDKDCGNSCCNDYICNKCPPLIPQENNIKDPKINAFITYLHNKMEKSLEKYVYYQQMDTKTSVSKNSNIGLGIYIKNTPGNRGSVKTWKNYLGNQNTNYGTNTIEPSFYFGSGTKPLTCIMVVAQLYKLWKKNNPTKDINEFITWYAGDLNQAGAPPAVNYKDLFKMTNGFENSNFTETLTQPSNTQTPGTGTPYTQTLQEWLFCCKNGGLIKNCEKTGIFCDNTCTELCPVALDTKTYGGKCQSPFCPANICDWVWYTDYTLKKIAENDPNSVPFQNYEYCNCESVPPSEYQNILQNLSVYDVTMMRSGISDADSVWGIDTSAQLASRTSAIGPIAFVSEISVFDWNPLWKKQETQENYEPARRPRVSKKNKNIVKSNFKTDIEQTKTISSVVENKNTYAPVTASLQDSIPGITNGTPSKYPAASYSSSSYTFLGILLWLLYDSKNRLDWTKIDLNQLLPRKVRNNINFAGTEGNNGIIYFNTDEKGNRYYSFEKTVTYGNITHPGIVNGSPIGITQTDHNINTPVFERTLPDGLNYMFVDWDASSGVMDGNCWGKCSDMAEIYMNILSPNADNPILGDKQLQKIFTENFINYNGSNWERLYNNRIRAPYCLGANIWSQDLSYNSGVMGPDWFEIFDYPNSDTKYGLIPCYGHLGATYGFQSGHIYFPGGKIKAYEPYKYNKYFYNDENWSITFDFCGGNEFTISQAHNNSNDNQSGAIQNLITELILDPFDWNKEY